MNRVTLCMILRIARRFMETPAQWRKHVTIRGPLHDNIFTLIEAVAVAKHQYDPKGTYNAVQEFRALMVEIAWSDPRMREILTRSYSPPTSCIPTHADDVSLVSINDSPFTTHNDIIYILNTCVAHRSPILAT